MNKEEVIKELKEMPRQHLYDVLDCLMDSGTLSVKDFFDFYEKRMLRIKSQSMDKVYEAEGVVYSMLYPLLYDTEQLSDAGKHAVADGIKFVESVGFHQTKSINERYKEKL